MIRRALLAALPLLLCAPLVGAQERLDAFNHAARLERLAITGDLGAPALPPVFADSPRDDPSFADRFPVTPDDSAYAGLAAPTLVDAVIPAGEGGTGTDKPEVFQYQLPAGYDPDGAPVPLVVAYHGYGESAKSVANTSLLDEECNARGWLFVAPTGIDDQLFGSPISQQNTEAAVRFMLDEHAVDRDRVYMVGFSMGGGVAANFAARRRDPDELMIAALVLVSPTGDWVMQFKTGDAATKTWMQNPYNFGAKPGEDLFAYQRASALYHDKASYPPLPGVFSPAESMARNLGATPTWLTWDEDDPLVLVQEQVPDLAALLTSLGGEVELRVVSGTVDGPLNQPAPHSWAVLDVPAAFDFLAAQRVERRPMSFDALLDGDGPVSHLHVARRADDALASLTARDGRTLAGLHGVEQVTVDASRLPEAPERYAVTPADGQGVFLTLGGFDARPERLLSDDGRLVHDVASDPAAGTLTVAVGGVPPSSPGALSAVAAGQAVTVTADPTWAATLTTSPNPLAVGHVAQLAVDAGGGAAVLLVVGPADGLQGLPGGLVAGVPAQPGVLVAGLALPPGGRIELPIFVPAFSQLVGTHLHAQARVLTASGAVTGLSNSWMVWFE